MPTILMVGEDVELSDFVEVLRHHGFVVEHVTRWRDWVEHSENGALSLIVLVAAPAQRDAIALFCSTVRRRGTTTPIFVLHDGSTSVARVRMLEAGADDCLSAPYDVEELIARSRALIRRSANAYDYPIRVGSLVLHPRVRHAFIDNERATLTDREFELLAYLARHPGKTLARSEIIDQVWGREAAESNVIDVHIRRLRSKLGKCAHYVETVRGVGYRLLASLELTDFTSNPALRRPADRCVEQQRPARFGWNERRQGPGWGSLHRR